MTVEPEPELRIGRVLKAHGVKGAVRVELLTDFPDRFAPGREVQVAGRRLKVARSEELDGTMLVTRPASSPRSKAIDFMDTVTGRRLRTLSRRRSKRIQIA